MVSPLDSTSSGPPFSLGCIDFIELLFKTLHVCFYRASLVGSADEFNTGWKLIILRDPEITAD